MTTRLVLAIAGLCMPALAQETFWIANRASSDIMQVSSWGSVLQRVATPTTLRGSTTAPDGKVWIVRFGSATVDIYDPVAASFTTAVLPSGSAYQIAFDAAGNAWITNAASAVHEFTATGTFLQTIALGAGAALGITVDANDNKWIAHRVSPASVSRIDTSSVATNYVIPGATMQPTAIIADYRGLATSSHIWVVGDGTAQLAEIDVTGATLFVYPMPATNIGSLAFDRNGDIWVGSFGNGTLLHVDETTGAVLNTYTVPPSINGLATDSQGRLLATVRVTFSGVGPPCELRRIDPATGALEIPTKLTLNGFNASGSQAAVSTAWQYSLVVAPLGDMDGDGDANWAEIQGGTSPTDPAASSTFRLESFGSTQNGSTPSFGVLAPSSLWIVGFAGALIPATPIPGFGGTLRLDPSTLLTTVAGFDNGSIPIAIPLNPGLIGIELFAQGVLFNGVGFDFRNVSGLVIW